MNGRSYHSFLLRLWRESAQPGIWRASLQEVKTEKVIGFGTLNDLLAYLERLTQHEEQEPQTPEKIGTRINMDGHGLRKKSV